VFVGQSVCVVLTEDSVVDTVMRLAATLEVDLQVLVEVPAADIGSMFQEAIAQTLGVSTENVVNLVVLDILEGGVRRLQNMVTQRQAVSYEIIPPTSADPIKVMEKANAIFITGTPEFKVFQQVLTAKEGVEQILSIKSKIRPRMFEDVIVVSTSNITTENAASSTTVPLRIIDQQKKEGSPLPPLILGIGCVSSVCLFCFASLAYASVVKRRKMRAPHRGTAGDKTDAV
jgi:hypothetical protein